VLSSAWRNFARSRPWPRRAEVGAIDDADGVARGTVLGEGLVVWHARPLYSPRARLRAVPPPPSAVRAFQRRLLAWYARHGRDLPWRRTRVPYRVLVSEIMLQQTQVDRVIRSTGILANLPDAARVASADVDEVRRLWYPLGYNVRPVRLHAIARETVARYGGRLPDDGKALRALPGVGRYTAGAMLSFAFGRDAAVLDTNVRACSVACSSAAAAQAPARRGAHVGPGRGARAGGAATTSTRRSWTSARPGARRAGRAARRARCGASARPSPPSRAGRGPSRAARHRGRRRAHSVTRPAAISSPSGAPAAISRGSGSFPGGKLEAGESPEIALRRELTEELGATFGVGKLVETVRWEYPDRTVVLHFYDCRWSPAPSSRARVRRWRGWSPSGWPPTPFRRPTARSSSGWPHAARSSPT